MCSLRGRGRLGLACLTVEFYCCHHSTLYLMFYKSASIHYFTRNDNHFTTYIPLQSVSLFWNIPYCTRANKGRSLYSKIIFQLTTMVCFDKFHAYQHKNERQNVIKMYLCGYYSRASFNGTSMVSPHKNLVQGYPSFISHSVAPRPWCQTAKLRPN